MIEHNKYLVSSHWSSHIPSYSPFSVADPDFPDPQAKTSKGEPVGASVDFATWTEQVRQRCNFDAGAISRGLVRQGSKDLTERQDAQHMCYMVGPWSLVNLTVRNDREITVTKLIHGGLTSYWVRSSHFFPGLPAGNHFDDFTVGVNAHLQDFPTFDDTRGIKTRLGLVDSIQVAGAQHSADERCLSSGCDNVQS